MPIYEYECKTCQETKEVLVRSPGQETDLETRCPDCGSAEIQRVFSVPAAPAVAGGNLPMASPGPAGESCGMPRCCGGGCQL